MVYHCGNGGDTARKVAYRGKEKGRKFFSRCDASFKRSNRVVTSTFD